MMVFGDRSGDVAAIERLADGSESASAVTGRRGTLLSCEVVQCAPEICLDKELTHLRWSTVRQVDGCIARPSPIVFGVLGDQLCHQRIHRKTFGGKADGRICNITEAHGAEAL